MKRSDEIERFGRKVVDAINRGDLEFLKRATSRDRGSILIGSGPREYLREYDEIIKALSDQIASSNGDEQVNVRIDEIRGYEQGEAAWADGRGAFETNDGQVGFRFTLALLREDGEWRIVQNHASIGVPSDIMYEPMFQPTAAASP
jgi:ketosteroid isomerase-like protein